MNEVPPNLVKSSVHRPLIYGCVAVAVILISAWLIVTLFKASEPARPQLSEEVRTAISEVRSSVDSSPESRAKREENFTTILSSPDLSVHGRQEWEVRQALDALLIENSSQDSFAASIKKGTAVLNAIIATTSLDISDLAWDLAIAGYLKSFSNTSFSLQIYDALPAQYRFEGNITDPNLQALLSFYELSTHARNNRDLTIRTLGSFYAAHALRSFSSQLSPAVRSELMSNLKLTVDEYDELEPNTYPTYESGPLFSTFYFCFTTDTYFTHDGVGTFTESTADEDVVIDECYKNLLQELSERVAIDKPTSAYIEFLTALYYVESVHRRYTEETIENDHIKSDAVSQFLARVHAHADYKNVFRFYLFDTLKKSKWDTVRSNFVRVASSSSELSDYLRAIGLLK